MATELGVAYLSLSASTRDFAKDVKAAMGDVEGSAQEPGQQFGSSIKKGAKIAAGAIAGVTGIVAGLALKGGISRALAIEDAQAKMRGLGHDTETVDTIMANALASVKGTAFGLGDAATTAAGAVAAGIEPGAELERVLSSVANSAAAAGTDLAEMGSIYNDAATQNKATNRILQQVAQRGLPIYQALADQLGVTADEVFDLASAGKIGFADFEAAMTSASGTVAAEMGETLRGRVSNTMAALSRLGESVVGGVLPQISDALGDAMGTLDSWGPAAERAGQALGNALSGAITFVRGSLIPALSSVVGWIRDNASWLGPLTTAVVAAVGAWKAYMTVTTVLIPAIKAARVAMLAFNATLLANPIGLIVAAVAALVAGLVWFFTQTELGQQIWQRVWGAIQTAVGAVVDWWQNTAMPAFLAAWDLIAPVFEAVGELFRALWEGIVQPYLSLVVAFWSQVWAGIQAVWRKIGPPIMSAIQAAIRVVQTVWTGVWNAVKAVFQGVWNAMKIVVETILGVIKGVITAVTRAIQGDWSGAWNAIKGVFESIWDGMKRYVQNAIDTVARIVGTIKDTVLGVFRTAGTWLKDAGRKIIEGLADGIRGAVSKATDAIKGVTQKIRDHLPFSPAKVGPFSGRGHSLYSGQALAEDFAKGMLSRERALASASGQLMGAAALVPPRAGIPGGAFTDDETGLRPVAQTNHYYGLGAHEAAELTSAKMRVAMIG